jgi:ABC-type glycerol-3-phosphate transport system substrate-binding protein
MSRLRTLSRNVRGCFDGVEIAKEDGFVRSAKPLALLVVLALAACSGPTSSGAPAASTAAATTAASSTGSGEPPASAAAELSGPLTVWDFHYDLPGSGDALKKIDADFTALHPNVKIDHVFVSDGTKVPAAFAAGSGGDVIMSGALYAGPVADGEKGAVIDLKPYFTQDELDQYLNLANFSKGGDTSKELYGLPQASQGFPWWYNKTVFAQAGLDRDTPPATWDDFIAALDKLKAAGVVPIAGGDKDHWFAINTFDGVWPTVFTPQAAIDLKSGKMKWTDPSIKPVFERTAKLYSYLNSDWQSIPNFLEGANRLALGKSGMATGLFADAANWQVYNPALGEDNVGLFITPGSKFIVASGVGWEIPTYVKDPSRLANAIAYLKYMTGKEGAQTRWDVNQTLPSYKGITLTGAVPQVVTEQKLLTDNEGQDSIHEWWSWGGTAIGDNMPLIVSGQETIEDAQADFQARQDKTP